MKSELLDFAGVYIHRRRGVGPWSKVRAAFHVWCSSLASITGCGRFFRDPRCIVREWPTMESWSYWLPWEVGAAGSSAMMTYCSVMFVLNHIVWVGYWLAPQKSLFGPSLSYPFLYLNSFSSYLRGRSPAFVSKEKKTGLYDSFWHSILGLSVSAW